MSDFQSPRRARRLPGILLLVALLGGGAFLWTHSDPLSPPALAAPTQKGSKANGAARPKPASAAEKNAAIKSIRGQLHAFDIGDWKGAVAFQSNDLKGNFATPTAFGAMIQHAYPAFIGARRVDFGPALSSGPMLQMLVRLSPRQGQPVEVIYMLVKEEGQYHISGVQGGMAEPDSGAGDHPQPPSKPDGSVIA